MPEPAERPPIATQPISLVLVAHNAAADIEGVVKSWTTQLDGLARFKRRCLQKAPLRR